MLFCTCEINVCFLSYVDKIVIEAGGDRLAVLDVGCELIFAKIIISPSNGIWFSMTFSARRFAETLKKAFTDS